MHIYAHLPRLRACMTDMHSGTKKKRMVRTSASHPALSSAAVKQEKSSLPDAQEVGRVLAMPDLVPITTPDVGVVKTEPEPAEHAAADAAEPAAADAAEPAAADAAEPAAADAAEPAAEPARRRHRTRRRSRALRRQAAHHHGEVGRG